jgi:hypothetical protein
MPGAGLAYWRRNRLAVADETRVLQHMLIPYDDKRRGHESSKERETDDHLPCIGPHEARQ